MPKTMSLRFSSKRRGTKIGFGDLLQSSSSKRVYKQCFAAISGTITKLFTKLLKESLQLELG